MTKQSQLGRKVRKSSVEFNVINIHNRTLPVIYGSY